MTQSLVNVGGDNAALPAVFAEFEQYAGAGMENITASDLLIPRIAILQALSDQVKPKHANYIQGAQVGDIADLGTGEILPNPIQVIVCHYSKVWVEWHPRSTGKGLEKIHPTDEIMPTCQQNDRKQWISPAGTIVEETGQFFVLNLSNERRSFIPMKSTQLKKAKKINTLLTSEKIRGGDGSSFTPPIWYRSLLLGSAAESNNDGDWYGWTVNRGPAIHELPHWKEIKEAAIEFRDAVTSGMVRGDVASDVHSDDTL